MRKYIVKPTVLLLTVMFMMLFALGVSAASYSEASPIDSDLVISEVYDSGDNYADIELTAKKSKSQKEKKEPDLMKTVLISMGISAAITLIVVFAIYYGYKSNGKTEPYPYNKKAPLDLSVSEDIHVDTDVTRRKIEKNNN